MRVALLPCVIYIAGACTAREPAGLAGATAPATRTATGATTAPRDLPAEQWYFWTDDRVRHYVYEVGRARGPGDTAIVLHGGWGAEHSYLVEPLSAVADEFRLVFYDQRGSLRSPAADTTITLPRMVADLEHLRQSMGLERVMLVAHSMGGALAYAYLAAHAERVRGLVLIGAVFPAPFTNAPNMSFIREVWPEADSAHLSARQSEFFRQHGERSLRIIEREGLLPDSLRGVPWDSLDLFSVHRDRDRTRTWRITFAAVNSCTAERWREMRGGMVYYNQRVANALLNHPTYAPATAEFWPALRRFQGPVRVLYGTCDYVDIGPEIWPRIVSHLPDAQLSVIEQAGHSIWMDNPDAFARELRRALSGGRTP